MNPWWTGAGIALVAWVACCIFIEQDRLRKSYSSEGRGNAALSLLLLPIQMFAYFAGPLLVLGLVIWASYISSNPDMGPPRDQAEVRSRWVQQWANPLPGTSLGNFGCVGGRGYLEGKTLVYTCVFSFGQGVPMPNFSHVLFDDTSYMGNLKSMGFDCLTLTLDFVEHPDPEGYVRDAQPVNGGYSPPPRLSLYPSEPRSWTRCF